MPVVLDGGKVAGGHDGGPLPEEGIAIKAGKLRGVPSNGMMCSIEELGSDRNFYPEAPENGIYIFSDDVQIGADAVEELGLRDTVFEYEVTSNRVDCYSVIGIAREAAATLKAFSRARSNGKRKWREGGRLHLRGSAGQGTLPQILCESLQEYQDRAFAEVDAEAPCSQRHPPHQQLG